MMRPWSGQMRWRGVRIAAPRWIGRVLALVALIQLAGCGQLPEPFLGNPGAAALRLRQPPDPRLAVPPAATALLSDQAGAAFAADLAQALRHDEVQPTRSRRRRRTGGFWSPRRTTADR